MATHSSTLAWKIPWTEEPGRLQSMASLRVRNDWATSLSLFTFMHWRRKWQPIPVFLPGESQGWGSLPSMGSHRVGHDWNDLAAEVRDRGIWRFQGRDAFDIMISPTGFEDGEDHMARMPAACRSWAALGWPPVIIWGPQSYNCRELNLAHRLHELGSRFFSRDFRGKCRPPAILISAL